MARLGGSDLLNEAVKSYDEALVLLESLPLEENALYIRRLAITWINRGAALQKREDANGFWEASECFREAVAVLGHPMAELLEDRFQLEVGARANLADALACSGETTGDEARLVARRTLELAASFERTDRVMAEAALKARHVLCRLVARDLLDGKSVTQERAAEVTDAVDEATVLVRHWQSREPGHFGNLARAIFRLGCRIYAHSQPHFLAEFLVECLDSKMFCGPAVLDQETFDAARAAIWTVLENLQVDGFHFVATPRFEPFLADIRLLREVEERLGRLRLGGVSVDCSLADCASERQKLATSR
jgi:hypothetical protein